MIIQVTKEDTAHVECECMLTQCMVAKALKHATGKRWEVSFLAAFLIEGNKSTRFDLPPFVSKEIDKWYEKKFVEPFSFELPIEVTP